MTIKEVIETIKTAIAEVVCNHPLEYAVAFEKAIEALEKQVPKKSIDYIDIEDDRVCACCCCKKPIVNVWSRADYKPKYCHYCGQALDWSEEE